MSRPFVLLVAALLAAFLSPFLATHAHGDERADLEAARGLERQGRWAASESLATATLGRLEGQPAPDSLAIAEALRLIAVAKWKTAGYVEGSGMRAASRSLGIRERRLGPDHLDVAESEALLARFLAGTGRPDSAVVHVRRALDIRVAQLAPDDTLLAKTWDQIALVKRDSRDMRGALDAWNHAIEIRRRVHGPEHPEVAILLAQTGVPWMELGDLDRARQVLEESIAMFARVAPDDRERWIPLNLLADVEFRSGNPARDLDLLEEALRIVRAGYGEKSREALTLRTNLAIGLSEIGDYAGCQAVNATLLPDVEAEYGPSHPRTLTVRQGLAIACRANGDVAGALRQFGEIDSVLAARAGPPDPTLSTLRSQMGELLYRQGKDAEAKAMSERAVRTELGARQLNGARLAGAYQILLMTLESSGDTAAIDSVRLALIRTGRSYTLDSARAGVSLHFWLARAARALGRADEAWTEALAAERMSRERLRLTLQSLPDRRALLSAQHEYRYLELVLEMAGAGAPERLATAWDRLVRTRGMVRAELARRQLPRGVAADTSVASAHERWLVAQRRWARRAVMIGGAPRDSAARAALERLRASAEDAEADYARALRAHDRGLPVVDVGLAESRARLRHGQALVSIFQSRRDTRRWYQIAPNDTGDVFALVTRGGSDAIERIDLGTTIALRPAIAPWRERLATSPGAGKAHGGDAMERACRRYGRLVRARVWDPIAARLGGTSDVYLVPDGVLFDLPWQALPDGDRRYLVETGPRLHLLNAERELAESTATSTGGSLLAVGAPDFERGGPAAKSAVAASWVRSAPDPCASAASPVFAPLPGSGREVLAVAESWRRDPAHETTVLTGADATESSLKRNAPNRAMLHIATHGLVATDTCGSFEAGRRGVGGVGPVGAGPPHPLSHTTGSAAGATQASSAAATARSPWLDRRVWLALAGANHAREHTEDENEGILTAEEVLTLDLTGTDWVVLSACHSGLAESWSREGALGMGRAFDLAGARTVITSQWAVEDEATREWMQALYAARAAGAARAAEAMESASRAVLGARRKANRSTHPFYWAAFSAIGE